jgi:phospholipid/cholesterol/gamma-HCH transport system substrate-binding protein
MRRANSTFVNLRSTLDEIDPLVEESKPVTPKLRRVLAELRPFARDATPTIRDLADLSKSPGQGRRPDRPRQVGPAVPRHRHRPGAAQRQGAPGSFATSTESLRRQRTPFAFFRPYLVDFTGWLDDFSHSGIYDAYGSASRVATSVNAFATVGGSLKLVPQQLRDELAKARDALRAEQPLPRVRRASRRGQEQPVEADPGLQLRPQPAAPGALT